MKQRLAIAMVCALAACSKPEPAKNAITATSGPLVVTATEAFRPLADTLVKEFVRLYPTVRPAVRFKSTREAITDLLNDSVQTVLVDRNMNAEERAVAEQAGIGWVDTRIAWDALVVAVNAENPVERITPRIIGGIVAGTVQQWSDVPGGSRKLDGIEFVTTGRNTGLYEVIRDRFTPGKDLKVFAAGRTQDELVAYVGRSQKAMTLVSLMAVRERPATVKVLAVESPADSTGKLAFVAPGQMPVYTGDYGLRSALFVINAERRAGPGVGFAAFVLTTPAQKIVQNSGLVPAVIPNRLIQLTSE